MKKVNIRNFLLFLVVILIISTMKIFFINSFDYNSYFSFINYILIYWSDAYILNIIWLLPIILNIVIVSKKYFFEIQHFDTRYINRKRFINLLLIKICLSSFFTNITIILLQIIIISFFSNISIKISIDVVLLVLCY
ncbi:MAG: hypothetical protein RSD09_07065, partial [Bacilli bacterium]